MPELPPELLLALMPIAAALLLAALLVPLHLAARRRVDALAAELRAELETLRADGRAGAAAVAEVATRIERLASVLDTDQRHRTAPAARTEAGYELAIRLARSGAGAEELINACGMSRKEAEVVARLHGRPAAPAATARNRLAVVPR